MMETLFRNEDALGNGAESTVLMGAPYSVHVAIEGVADLLFHRWNCEAVDAKAKAARGDGIIPEPGAGIRTENCGKRREIAGNFGMGTQLPPQFCFAS